MSSGWCSPPGLVLTAEAGAHSLLRLVLTAEAGAHRLLGVDRVF